MNKLNSKIPRPLLYLNHYSRCYPTLWKSIEEQLLSRDPRDPDWPDYCFLAHHKFVRAFTPVMTQYEKNMVEHIEMMIALASWRLSQGIYRFDKTVYREVTKTQLEGIIPAEIFYALPEWCLYIETPDLKTTGNQEQSEKINVRGCFVHLQFSHTLHCMVLQLILDGDVGDITQISSTTLSHTPYAIRLDKPWDLATLVQHDWADRKRILAVASTFKQDPMAFYRLFIYPILSQVMYLCTKNVEISSGCKQPMRYVPKKTKRGLRYFAAKKVTVWDVGSRLGKALSAAMENNTNERSGPRPHIRRAHWHTYRVGPGKIHTILKWLPPIAVNADSDEEIAHRLTTH